MKVSCKYIE